MGMEAHWCTVPTDLLTHLLYMPVFKFDPLRPHTQLWGLQLSSTALRQGCQTHSTEGLVSAVFFLSLSIKT